MEHVNIKELTAELNQVKEEDKAVYDAIMDERERQQKNIELIASENFVTEAVMEAQGSILTNKYAEGYPGRRYYGGCEHVDVIEDIARDRLKEILEQNMQTFNRTRAHKRIWLFTFQC